MLTPDLVLADLIAHDASRPLLTCYDDTPGPTNGERIELSRHVVATWTAKAANALQEGLDVEPGSVVLLDLPAPHWRLAYWALAVWSVGATVTLDDSEGADVLVTTDPDCPAAEDADEVIAVTLPALAREFGAELRTGVMDEAHDLASYGDSFTAWEEPDPEDVALVHEDGRTTYQDLMGTAVDVAHVADGARVLITTEDRAALLLQLLAVLRAGGSAVLVRGGGAQTADEPRMQDEGVTASLSAGG